jgi:hypothetical protein
MNPFSPGLFERIQNLDTSVAHAHSTTAQSSATNVEKPAAPMDL